MEGMTAQDAPACHETPTKTPILANGLERILRAGRSVDASCRKEGRYKPLVQAYTRHHGTRHDPRFALIGAHRRHPPLPTASITPDSPQLRARARFDRWQTESRCIRQREAHTHVPLPSAHACRGCEQVRFPAVSARRRQLDRSRPRRGSSHGFAEEDEIISSQL